MNWLDSILKPGSHLSMILIGLVAASLGGVLLSLIGLEASERKHRREIRIKIGRASCRERVSRCV